MLHFLELLLALVLQVAQHVCESVCVYTLPADGCTWIETSLPAQFPQCFRASPVFREYSLRKCMQYRSCCSSAALYALLLQIRHFKTLCKFVLDM